MNVSYLNVELARIRSRTRKSAAASVALHVLLFLCLYMIRATSPQAEALVEVSWIEPTPSVPAVAKSESRPENVVVQTRSVRKIPEYFVRGKAEAEVTPQPQLSRAQQDKLNKRLSSLQRDAVERRSQVAALTTSSVMTTPSLAGVPVEEREYGNPGELSRERARVGQPEVLSRTPVRTTRPALAVAQSQQIQVTPEPAKPVDSTARRTLAGASLSGPVADRPLVTYSTPVYPEWAKKEGVEAVTRIYFLVLPDGKVKTSVVVEKTSGFEDFDRNAVDALLAWRFQPLPGSQTGEQWGRITFHFRLSSAGTS